MADWQHQVESFLQEAVRERNWDLMALSKEQRRELLRDLKERGGFSEKRAAELVASLMNIPTDTVKGLIQ